MGIIIISLNYGKLQIILYILTKISNLYILKEIPDIEDD
jgi:hypothetical protein